MKLNRKQEDMSAVHFGGERGQDSADNRKTEQRTTKLIGCS